MALNIKDPATERAVRELAAETGEKITTTVRKAVEERRRRLGRRPTGHLRGEILAIGARCAALPDIDVRSAEERLAYDEHGPPT